mmetsp:Transcript_75422/g.151628  ORF Transcript_75422/g.151628 Transcript_75422/m.151628 type:complete len:238 (-) Transcript_75422:140-853(-)
MSSLAGEDILLCIDVNSEMGELWGEGGSSSRLDTLKTSISHFVRHKAAINKAHRFGVCVLTDGVSLNLEPTGDIDLVLAIIDACREAPSEQSFELDKLVHGIDQWFGGRLRKPVLAHARTIRCVVFYGRSYAMPTCTSGKPTALLDHPLFFLDILYVHKKLSKENPEKNICQDAYDFFMDTFECDSDEKSEYIVEVSGSGSTSRLHQHMAMLLAHPKTRDDQDAFLEKYQNASSDAT